ncbi:MAG: prepilin-type N-terminal cleavage/methylation domain-containing protein [Planctomycetota bacterium]|nr:MAG: prepilin-type N-terminal cleavage/methylation domain-containing protein [Planctomycetota bacterium]
MGGDRNLRRHSAGARTQRTGFTLIELMIVVAVVAVVSSLAVPKLMSSRLTANESAAISNLRAIASAQEQFRSSYAVDSDGDGGGEYGFLGEISGVAGLREFAGGAAVVGAQLLTPSMLPFAFGNLQADAWGEGVVVRSGYCYKLYLPGPSVGGVVGAIGEDGGGVGGATPGNEPNAQNCEILWCAYAWPSEAGKTGHRAFFVNQDGDMLQFANFTDVYSGTSVPIPFDAAFSSTSPGNMNAKLGILGDVANDGNAWKPLH